MCVTLAADMQKQLTDAKDTLHEQRVEARQRIQSQLEKSLITEKELRDEIADFEEWKFELLDDLKEAKKARRYAVKKEKRQKGLANKRLSRAKAPKLIVRR